MTTSVPNFVLPSSISFFDMEGLPKSKLGAADLPRHHLAGKILRGATVLLNTYTCTKFLLPSSISFGDMEGVPK